MIKVLMIGNDNSVKGGITSVITQILNHNWKLENVNIKFIPTYIESNNIKKILFFIKSYFKIKIEIMKNKPDILYMHMSYKGSFIRKNIIHKICMKKNIPTIIHLHGSEFKKWYDSCNIKKQKKIKKMLEECSSFIVLGEKWNKIVKEIEPKTRSIIVNNTISIPNYVVEWNNPFRFLFLGKLIERKGVSDLLKAINELNISNQIENFEFKIVGNGEEEKNLKKMCKDYELNEYVQFIDWIHGEEKEKLLQSCQCLILPSYNEGLPISILEAISYGMPVIASNVGDISSAVIENENGYLITPGNITELLDSIMKVSSEMKQWDYLSKNARKIAEDKFSDLSYFKILKTVFENVLEENKK